MKSVKEFKLTCLVAENNYIPRLKTGHGLSYLISVNNKKILMDVGSSAQVLLNNMKLMGIGFEHIDFFFLTYGRHGHIYTLADLWAKIKENQKADVKEKLEALYSPYAKINQFISKTKESKKLQGSHKEKIIGTISDVKSLKKSSEIVDGAMISGSLPAEYLNDIVLYVNIEGKGLVIITGHAHPGILNIINDAKKITGIDEIYGLIGGDFNLKGRNEEEIKQITNTIKENNINFIFTSHIISKTLKSLRSFLRTIQCKTITFGAGQKLIIK